MTSVVPTSPVSSPTVLLDRVTDAHAEQSTRPQTIDRLRGLEARPEGIREWILEVGQARKAIWLEQRERDEGQAEAAHQQHHVAESPTARPVRA
jgi:hypothetical protein